MCDAVYVGLGVYGLHFGVVVLMKRGCGFNGVDVAGIWTHFNLVLANDNG
jgi:hypothetical protein